MWLLSKNEGRMSCKHENTDFTTDWKYLKFRAFCLDCGKVLYYFKNYKKVK